MSIATRRSSQRLAKALEVLSSDLSFNATGIETVSEENIQKGVAEAQKYWGDLAATGREAIQLLGDEQQEHDADVRPVDQEPNKEENEVVNDKDNGDGEVLYDDQNDNYDQNNDYYNEVVDDGEVLYEQPSDYDDTAQSSIMQGDPGVDEFGSESTFDTDSVLSLGPDYGVDFDGDQYLQESIRDVPKRISKKARIKKLIARIENVANKLEASGRKSLAYRLDVVCNNLEEKYLKR